MGKFKAKKKYESTETSGGDIRRMKFAQGTNVIRIVNDNFEDAWVHYFKDKEGNNKRTVCLGKGKCPVCDNGERATHRFFFNVIDRKAQKESKKTEIKVMEVGKMIYEQVRELALDEEYGDPTQYNLKITRKGEKKTTKYSVRASTKKYSLDGDEKEVVKSDTDEGGAYDLAMFVTKQTKSELLALLGKEGDSEEEGEDEEGTEDTDTDEEDQDSDDDEKEDDDKDEDDGDLDIDKELEDLEDEDEEEEPAKKKKSKKKKKVAKKEEDDEEEDW